MAIEIDTRGSSLMINDGGRQLHPDGIIIAVDATEHVPLRFRIYPAASDKAAFEVAFTMISFDRPDDAQFTFNPPAGTKVTVTDIDGKPQVVKAAALSGVDNILFRRNSVSGTIEAVPWKGGSDGAGVALNAALHAN